LKDLPPSAGLAELALALGYSYLSLEEAVEELRRVGGSTQLQRAADDLTILDDVEPDGLARAQRLIAAAIPSPADHLVAFYENDGFLATSVGAFLSEGLRRGERVEVIATPEHRQGFEAALRATGHDVARCRRAGIYVEHDAASTLAGLVVDGALDIDRFDREIGASVAEATVGGRGLRIYGEMVALLSEAGQLVAALELEDRWNQLLARFPIPLFCGYPMRMFDSEEADAHFHDVCGRHSAVTTESYAHLVGDGQGDEGAVLLGAHEPGGSGARAAGGAGA
jgi:hypothetical protein